MELTGGPSIGPSRGRKVERFSGHDPDSATALQLDFRAAGPDELERGCESAGAEVL